MAETAVWLGHDFTVFDPDDGRWHKVGGLYVFAELEKVGQGKWQWYPWYIGRTHDFSDRLSNHDRWSEAVQLGATHIHAMVMDGDLHRAVIEKDLIEKYQPYMNTLLKG